MPSAMVMAAKARESQGRCYFNEIVSHYSSQTYPANLPNRCVHIHLAPASRWYDPASPFLDRPLCSSHLCFIHRTLNLPKNIVNIKTNILMYLLISMIPNGPCCDENMSSSSRQLGCVNEMKPIFNFCVDTEDMSLGFVLHTTDCFTSKHKGSFIRILLNVSPDWFSFLQASIS